MPKPQHTPNEIAEAIALNIEQGYMETFPDPHTGEPRFRLTDKGHAWVESSLPGDETSISE